MAPAETLSALAHTFLERLCTLDMDAMLAIRTPSCIHSIGPDSMNRPVMDNDAYARILFPLVVPASLILFSRNSFRAAYAPMLPHFHTMSVEIRSLLIDTVRNAAVLHTKSRASTVGGPYDIEYVYLLHATPDGAALCRIEEFVDSARAQAQGARLKEAIVAQTRTERKAEMGEEGSGT